jgi:hypothetical protein
VNKTMTNLQSKVNHTVQGFVAQVVELVRHAALESLQTAFAAPGATIAAPPQADPEPALTHLGHLGRRRTPEDLDDLAKRLAIVVRANPGLRIAELAERLGTPTRQLSVPIRKLVAEGTIQPRGRRRATTYVAAAAPAADAAAPASTSSAPPAEFDADWHRCLASVYMLAHKLQK